VRGAWIVLAGMLAATASYAALDTNETEWDGSEPAPGVYFAWYEPSFYTGFAPRTQDPERVHIELARGNQVRVTVVLGDAELDAYLDDLVQRRKVYQELIDRGVIELTPTSSTSASRRAWTKPASPPPPRATIGRRRSTSSPAQSGARLPHPHPARPDRAAMARRPRPPDAGATRPASSTPRTPSSRDAST
jgi:hypothetical protein